MKDDNILQMMPCMMPLRAVFHNVNTDNGMDVAVVGFALVESFIDESNSTKQLVGIAVCEEGLDICESYPNFVGYSDAIRYVPATGEILENNPEKVYQLWLKKQNPDAETDDRTMRVVRNNEYGPDDKFDNEPDENQMDGYNNAGYGSTS